MGRERSIAAMEKNSEKHAVISPGMKVRKYDDFCKHRTERLGCLIFILEFQGNKEDMRKALFGPAKSPAETGRPSSMVIKVRATK